MAQAGAFLAVVVGLVAGVQTTALAIPPTVNIESLSDSEVTSGTTVTMQYTVRNPGAGGVEDPNVRIQVSGGMQCRSGCSPNQDIQDEAPFTATLTAPNVRQGETQEITITVTARLEETGETGSASETIRVKGPEAPQTVRQVSGRVKSSDGERLSGVDVAMTDSAGGQFSARTNGSGNYSFTSSDSKPIAPGAITVGAAKDGFEAKTVNAQGAAGRSVNVSITLKKLATETPSPSPSASVSASAEPTEEVVDDEEPTPEASDAAGGVNADNLSAESDSGTNWLLIIMGVLLVAAGIGAFLLVWLRRKNNSEDEPADESMSPGFGGAGPATAGAFDATRVAAPVGAGRGGDATMIAPAGGMPGGISDVPTMVHRPVEDEFPDPYGAPIPPQGGFAGANNQWDDQGNDGYGGDQQYGQQGGYGGGDYGNAPQQRYDEHTNLYQPEQPQQPQRYDEHTSLYQPEQGGGGYGAQQAGGYGSQDDWGGQGDAGNGYGPQDGYGQQPAGGGYGGYDQQQGGYDDQGGYGGQQYGAGQQQPQQYGGQQGGYDQQRGGAYGGYDQQQGGYGDQEGYYGPPNGQPGQPRPKRNDWDD